MSYSYNFGTYSGAAGTGSGLDAFTVAQLNNIGGNIITADNWSAVNSLNQDLNTTSSVQFTSITDGTATLTGGNISATNISAMKNTGHSTWTGSGAYWSFSAPTFTLERGGTGYIKSGTISYSGSQTATITQNQKTYLYIDSAGDLQQTDTYSGSLFEDNIVLFEVLLDGSNNIFVKKENHPYCFDVGASNYLHSVAGTVFGNSSQIEPSGTAGKIKLVGDDTLYDHGLSTSVSAADPITINYFYTDGSGDWQLHSASDTVPQFYNNTGTPTALSSVTKRGVFRIYGCLDNLNSSAVQWIGVMGIAEYSNSGAAETAIANGDVPEASNELISLEPAQMGYVITVNNTIEEIIMEKTTFNTRYVGGSTASSHLLLSDKDGGQYLDGGHANLTITEISASSAPNANDDTDAYKKGTIWIKEDTDNIYVCTDNTDGAAVWKTIARETENATFATLQGTTVTDGTASLNGGDITGAGSITATTFTDGTASLTGGALSAVDSITLSNASKIFDYGTSNFFAGKNAGNLTLTGSFNVGIGENSLASLTSGTNNTALGYRAGNLTDGTHNTTIGTNSGNNLAGGDYNTCLGSNTGGAITTGNGCIFVGYGAATGGGTAPVYETVIGYSLNGHGDNTTTIGRAQTTNTYLGRLNLNHSALTAERAITFGDLDMSLNQSLGTTDSVNFAGITSGGTIQGGTITDGTISLSAGVLSGITGLTANTLDEATINTGVTIEGIKFENSKGWTNLTSVAIGSGCNADANDISIGTNAGVADSGSNNVSIGQNAGNSMTSGAIGNCLIGLDAGTALTGSDYNTCLGYQSGTGLITGNNCVCIGYNAECGGSGDAFYGIAIGSEAEFHRGTLTTGHGIAIGRLSSASDHDIYIGYGSGNTSATGAYNIGIGYDAAAAITSGTYNILLGYDAGSDCTTGSSNSCMGHNAGYNLTTGGYNTFLGVSAHPSAGTYDYCTALGGYTEVGGSQSIAIGYTAKGTTDDISIGSSAGTSTSGGKNISIGTNAGNAITSEGIGNSSIGYLGGTNITSGDYNTCVGFSAGDSITTGSSNTAIGDSSDCAATLNNQIAIGANAVTTAANQVQIGDDDISSAKIEVDWTIVSDARSKRNIQPIDAGLDFIKSLNPVKFELISDATHKLRFGLIAQEVPDRRFVEYDEVVDKYGITYTQFIAPLIKAVQEQNRLIIHSQKRILSLEKKIYTNIIHD